MFLPVTIGAESNHILYRISAAFAQPFLMVDLKKPVSTLCLKRLSFAGITNPVCRLPNPATKLRIPHKDGTGDRVDLSLCAFRSGKICKRIALLKHRRRPEHPMRIGKLIDIKSPYPELSLPLLIKADNIKSKR